MSYEGRMLSYMPFHPGIDEIRKNSILLCPGHIFGLVETGGIRSSEVEPESPVFQFIITDPYILYAVWRSHQ